MLLLWVFLLPAVFAALPDRDYKIYRLIPANREQREALEDAYLKRDADVEFFHNPLKTGGNIDVQAYSEEFERFLLEKNIDFVQMHPNDDQKVPSNSSAPDNCEIFRLGKYCDYDSMIAYLQKLEWNHPHLVELVVLGMTHHGRPIMGARIGRRGTRAAVIDAGIHPREWQAPHSAMFFINELVRGYGSDLQITEILNKLTVFIIPVLNPDGYEYGRSADFASVRMWRGNRGPRTIVNGSDCSGTDLNRNFDFNFGEEGASNDSCAHDYHGIGAFSEPETRTIRDLIFKLTIMGKVDAYIAFHSFGKKLLLPGSDDKLDADLETVANKAADAMAKINEQRYEVGTVVQMVQYNASGGSIDWVHEIARVKYAFGVEVGPYRGVGQEIENVFPYFQPPKEELMPIAKESWEGVKVILRAAVDLHSNDCDNL